MGTSAPSDGLGNLKALPSPLKRIGHLAGKPQRKSRPEGRFLRVSNEMEVAGGVQGAVMPIS
jgi:hypothetical protein